MSWCYYILVPCHCLLKALRGGWAGDRDMTDALAAYPDFSLNQGFLVLLVGPSCALCSQAAALADTP